MADNFERLQGITEDWKARALAAEQRERELADALRMARDFLGMAIPGSQRSAAYVADVALARHDTVREERRDG